MNYLSQSWRIDRRHALRAMGTCIALPMLECMIPLRAAEKATESPRRSAFIYLANGVHSLNYQITKPGKDYQFSRALKPLEKHREVITPISGLHHPGALGHHHNCIDVFLTGGKLGPSDRNTISVDQKMAEVTAQHTRYPSMEIALTQGSLAWTTDGVQLPALRRCSEIFASMFEEPKGGIKAQRKALRRKASVLDDNLAEVRQLEKKIGAEDKGRLEQYLTSVREAEIRTRRADTWLDTPLPDISDTDRKRTNRDVPKTQAGDYFRTVYDLMVLAFQTDLTRVATFSLGGEGDAFSIPEIGITESRHQLSHHGGRCQLHGKAHQLRHLCHRAVRLLPHPACGDQRLVREAALGFDNGALRQRHVLRPQPRQRQPATRARRWFRPRPEARQPSRPQQIGRRLPGLRARPERSAHFRALPDLRTPREYGRPHEQPAPPHGPAHGRGS